jgi:hypothetical protein
MPDTVRHCTAPPSVIIWVGCLKGEHAGPMAWCAHHAAICRGAMICGLCGGAVRVLRITSMDGTSVVGDFGLPPAGTWRGIFSPP